MRWFRRRKRRQVTWTEAAVWSADPASGHAIPIGSPMRVELIVVDGKIVNRDLIVFTVPDPDPITYTVVDEGS